MENNWKEKAEQLATFYLEYSKNSLEYINCVNAILKGMNLIFEATKKECANKAECVHISCSIGGSIVDKESVLNINKPNL